MLSPAPDVVAALPPESTPDFSDGAAWQNCIAGFLLPYNLTLLDPSVSNASLAPRAASVIAYTASSSEFTVVFRNMAVTNASDASGNSDKRYTFAVTLHSSGLVDITLSSQNPTAAAVLPLVPVVGIRPPTATAIDSSYVQNLAVQAPRSLAAIVAVDPTFVMPDVTMQFCSLAGIGCLSPNVGATSGGSRVYIALSSQALGCLESIQTATNAPASMNCSFGGIESVASFDQLRGAFSCVAPAGVVNATILVSLKLYTRRGTTPETSVWVANSVQLLNQLDLVFRYVEDSDPSLPGTVIHVMLLVHS